MTHDTTSAKARLNRLLSIAFPMVVSQASETIMLFVDRLFLSRLGTAHLSAAMSGGLTTFAFASFFVGAFLLIVVWKVDPILSWAYFILFVISLGVSMVLRFRSGVWRRISLIEREPTSAPLKEDRFDDPLRI
jgi:Na+-driven multidrug efflux pump